MCNGGNKAVTAPWDSLDISRFVGIVTQHGADFLDGGIKRVIKFYKCVLRPYTIPQLFPRDQLAGTLQQKDKHEEWLALQLNSHSLATQFPAMHARLKRTEAENFSRRARCVHATTLRQWTDN